MTDPTLLSIKNLKKYFYYRDKTGKKSLIRPVNDISLSINNGDTFGLIGESGCGKTSLGRTILRLVEPDSGSILYDGKDITHVNMRPYRSRMQIIFQDPAGSLDPRCRISDIVDEGVRASKHFRSKAERKERVAELLESVGLDKSTSGHYPHEFSGGQQQRIGIARAIAIEPEFIVCDEPVSALDITHQFQIINLLNELQRRLGLTYLFISHDLSVVKHVSNRIGVMYIGRLVELGTSDEITANPAHNYTKKLLEAIPIPDPRISRFREREVYNENTELAIPAVGCRYLNQCKDAFAVCRNEEPELREVSSGHFCACHLYG